MKHATLTQPREMDGGQPRRRALFVGVAAASVLGGAGLAWWRQSSWDSEVAAAEALWSLEFDTPNGGTLRMASLRGKPLLLNFWATWCPPCVEELPMLDAFFRERSAAGWQVLGLAVDQVAPVRSFLGQHPLHFPIAMAGMPGVALSKSLGNISGGLPFSVVLGSNGSVLHRKIGKITPDDLRAWGNLG
jgi:thiol-disulfide isomerase/thioredoxin